MDDKMNDVIDEVQKRLGEEYEVKRVEVMKNNDTKLKGIQVRKKDMNVAKICYWTILTDDDGIDSDTYKDCLRGYNLIEGDYEFDDLICTENGSEWHIRVFIGTDAYWGFFYKCKTKEVCYGK